MLRLILAAGILLFVQFKLAAVFAKGCWISSVAPPNAKQETQMLGFSERRAIRSPQQTQIRGACINFGFIASSSNKNISKILSGRLARRAMSFEANPTECRIITWIIHIYKNVDKHKR